MKYKVFTIYKKFKFFFSLFSPSKIYEASYLSYSITQIDKHK